MKTLIALLVLIASIPADATPRSHRRRNRIPPQWCFTYETSGIEGRSCFLERMTCEENLQIESNLAQETVNYNRCRLTRMETENGRN